MLPTRLLLAPAALVLACSTTTPPPRSDPTSKPSNITSGSAPASEGTATPNPPSTLDACRDDLATWSSKPYGPSTVEDLQRLKEEGSIARAQIVAGLVTASCPATPGGNITIAVHHYAGGSTPVRAITGDIDDCAVAECVTQAVVNAITTREITIPLELGFLISLIVSEDGKMSEAPRFTPAANLEEYCGYRGAGETPSAELINGVMDSYSDAIAGCRRDHAHDQAESRGQMRVRLQVGHDGSVDEVSVEEYTSPDCSVGVCVLEVLRKMTFPRIEGGALSATFNVKL